MIKKQIFHYLFATFLVTVAYTLPHSILTVLLLEKGLSISQILIILDGEAYCLCNCAIVSSLELISPLIENVP